MERVSWRNVGKLFVGLVSAYVVLFAIIGWFADNSSQAFRENAGLALLFFLMFVLPAVAVIAFLLVVWPTMWRYDQVGSTLARTRRFDGRTEMLTPDGWQRVHD